VVPEIKEMVRSVCFSDAREVAEQALTIADPADVRRIAMERIGKELPDMPL
jgi:hypothetical protein